MIYTDKIHLVADSLSELHEFCKDVEIPRRYFEGVKKGHPHYDIPKNKMKEVLNQAILISSREILLISKTML